MTLSKNKSQRRIGAFLGYLNLIAKNLVNLVYTPMLLSFVGQSNYGVYQTSNSFVFSLSVLSFGFSQAYIRFYTQKRAHGEDVHVLNGVYLMMYTAVSMIALLLGLGFAARADIIFAASFTAEEIVLARSVMAVMACNIAITLFNSIFDAYIIAHEEFLFQQSRQMFTTLITPFCAYGLLCFGFGVVGVAIAQLVVNVALLALNANYCLNRLEMRFDIRHLNLGLFKAIAVFSAWIFANQVCDLVNQNVPNVLLGALTSASSVAVFAVSVQIRGVFYSLSTTMSSIFAPKINCIVADTNDNEELTRLMTRVGRYQMVLFCWIYGGFFLLGQYFVMRWAGEGFVDAYWLVLAMVAPLVIPLTQNTGIEIQRAKNMHRSRSIAMLVGALFNVIVTLVASPLIGYWAPAVGYIVCIIFCNGIFMNWYYQRRVGLDMAFFWNKNLPILLIGIVATAICFVGTETFPVNGWSSFLIWGVAYTVLFAIGLWFAVLKRGERMTVINRLLLRK